MAKKRWKQAHIQETPTRWRHHSGTGTGTAVVRKMANRKYRRRRGGTGRDWRWPVFPGKEGLVQPGWDTAGSSLNSFVQVTRDPGTALGLRPKELKMMLYEYPDGQAGEMTHTPSSRQMDKTVYCSHTMASHLGMRRRAG